MAFGIWAVALLLTVTACGKKGPPLPPNSRVPAPVQQIAATRVGNDVYLSFVVPAQNDDMTRPGVTRRVDIFGYTGFTEPPRGRFLDGAVLIASVPVAPAPPPEAPLPPATLTQVTEQGAAHGSLVRLVDHLEPEELVDKPLPPPPAVRGRPQVPAAAPRTPPLVNPVLRRFYMAIAWSDRDLPSAASTVTALPLTLLPEPPEVRATVEPPAPQAALLVEWEPSGGLIGFILDRQLGPEPAPVDEPPRAGPAAPAAPGGPTRYNIYRQLAPDPLALPVAAAPPSPFAVELPVPLNPAPLDTFAYREPVELDERERCYTVRAVRGTAPAQVEGEPSQPYCVRPIDVFGPAPPRDLNVIASEAGALTLSWDPGEEADLGGYLVLRREAGSDTLLSLVDAPIAATRYTDRTVTPGVRYVYQVVAVDTRLPVPNRSAPSNPIEELAR